MVEIKDKMKELVRVNDKLSELRVKTKRYTDRKKELENDIATYIKNNKLGGLKSRETGYRVIAESVKGTKRKPKKEQREDLRTALLNKGVRFGDDELDDLLSKLKTEGEDKIKIKLKKIIE